VKVGGRTIKRIYCPYKNMEIKLNATISEESFLSASYKILSKNLLAQITSLTNETTGDHRCIIITGHHWLYLLHLTNIKE
jgi:hypothetical protein